MTKQQEKPKVYLRGERWCIDVPGYAGLWAWCNTLPGAICEAMQLYIYGYRDHDVNGKRYL